MKNEGNWRHFSQVQWCHQNFGFRFKKPNSNWYNCSTLITGCIWWWNFMQLLDLQIIQIGWAQTLLLESKERLFHRFTASFPNTNSFRQKLYMKPTLQKIPGYNDGVARNMLLWRHKGRSMKTLYIENCLTYKVGGYLILSGRYIFLKSFKGSALISHNLQFKSA